ncbi:MAG: S49 family peptidase [Alphaproteobacteria bacterium]|nr:S49 family peptidase [Alphaproteobacteria bacterium]
MQWLLFWRRPRVPVIEFHGLFSSRGGSLNSKSYAPLIKRAFRVAKKCRHVVLDIDSPGGSPVQSHLIATLIRRQADNAGVKVVAVIQDVGASGGYWLACAADEILATPMSVVGSIGVLGRSFGLVGLIERLGIEARTHTAGAHKARLDPFKPERTEDIEFVKTVLDELHERFKEWVRTRRGSRLVGDEATLFDGSWFVGTRARELGLLDGFSDVDEIVRRIGGRRAIARVFRPRMRGFLRRLPQRAANAALDAIDEQHGRITVVADWDRSQ